MDKAQGCKSCGRPTRSPTGFCWQHSDMAYRELKAGEIIMAGDQVDICNDGWRDSPVWRETNCIGQPAPDPRYPSHRRYRRLIASPCENVEAPTT